MHFIRTGATSTEAEKRYVGQSDPLLCRQGVEQLERMKDQLEYPRTEMLFTSPLRRCAQTADILYPNLLTETVGGLADMDLGTFQGKNFAQLKENEDFIRWLDDSTKYSPPGGESVQEFTVRIVQGVNGIFNYVMEQGVRDVAVITHGGVIMTLLATIGLPRVPLHNWAVANGRGYTLLFTPQMWMRDGCAEVFRQIPQEPAGADEDYFNEG